MKVLLSCSECDYQAVGSTEKQLMNKIVMWNHVKRAHVGHAELVMSSYTVLPSDLYDVRSIMPITA